MRRRCRAIASHRTTRTAVVALIVVVARVVIRDVDAGFAEAVDSLLLGRGRFPFKPAGGTPRILVRNGHDAVFDGVAVGVGESRKVAPFVGESRVAPVVPDFAAGGGVEFVHPLGHFFVECCEHWAEGGGVFLVAGRFADEVVVVGEDGPGFENPTVVAGYGEESAMQDFEPFASAEEVFLFVGGGGDEVGAGFAENVTRGVRPGCVGLIHG